MASEAWVRRARGLLGPPPAASWPRPLRIATDMDGFAAAELAWGKTGALPPTSVFASSTSPVSQKLLRDALPGAAIFTDFAARVVDSASITGRAVGGERVRVDVGSADLDVYVAGALRNPDATKDGDADEVLRMVSAALQVIVTCRPRAFILEMRSKHVVAPVAGLCGYAVRKLCSNATSFGLPQARHFTFAIGLRTDALRAPAAKCLDLVALVMRAAQPCKPAGPWPQWLRRRGLPVSPQTSQEPQGSQAAEEFVPAAVCHGCKEDAGVRYSSLAVCALHPCQCLMCRRHGVKAGKCAWRRAGAHQAARTTKARAAYIRAWRAVKQDTKRAPNYWELASARGLRVPRRLAMCPASRHLLKTESEFQNLMVPEALVECKSGGDAAHRSRMDGLAPAVTATCHSLFAPDAGVFLTPPQCFALQGVGRDDIPEGRTEEELYELAGQAWPVPLYGTLLWAVVAQLAPPAAAAPMGGA